MDGRETDDDDTPSDTQTQTNRLTGHTASWAATQWAYTSLKATFPLPPPTALKVPRAQTTANKHRQATGRG